MLRAPCTPATGRLASTRQPLARRCVILRADNTEGSLASTSALERFTNSSDEKVKATISSLDALLPSAPPAPTTSSRASSSASASTSAPSRPSSTPSMFPAADSRAPPPQRKLPGVSFEGLMGFGGLAPEVINGRAAMIGFLVAITNELRTGESVFSQMVSGGGMQMLAVILAVTVASFAPAIRGTSWERMFGKDKQPAEFGPFSPFAEALNGRAAMIGIGLLIFFEGASPSAFFMN